nr:cellulose synthase A catalytic subunit 1 [UDP-forming] [Tanacetum cinerariifolium]
EGTGEMNSSGVGFGGKFVDYKLKFGDLARMVYGKIPNVTDKLSVRSTSVLVRIMDPSKDLNSYGLGNVDWKERIEGLKLKHDKNMMQMANKYGG